MAIRSAWAIGDSGFLFSGIPDSAQATEASTKAAVSSWYDLTKEVTLTVR